MQLLRKFKQALLFSLFIPFLVVADFYVKSLNDLDKIFLCQQLVRDVVVIKINMD